VKRILVLGLGVYGMQLVRTLARLGAHVVAVDSDRRIIESVKRLVAEAFVADARDARSLSALDVKRCEAAVVCLGDDFEATETCLMRLKELGCPRVLARATTEERADILEALGPDGVITPTLDEARKMGQILMTPSVEDYARLRGGRSIVLYRAPEAFVGKKLAELRLGSRFKAFTVGIQARSAERSGSVDSGIDFRPTPDTVIQEGDLLYIFGYDEDLLRLASRYA
jgi:trk system potassium uptake protein TrkA